ncbi:GTP cyclohydrolase 1 [Metarhizium anisopliae]
MSDSSNISVDSACRSTDIERDEILPTADASIVHAPLTDRPVNASEKCRNGFGKVARGRIDETPEQVETRLETMRNVVRTLLECLGEDPDREGLLATPSRYANALLFLTKGYQVNVDDVVNNALFDEEHHEMVIIKGIEFSSLCEHHVLPFTGKPEAYENAQIHIGYIPSGKVIGLSKLPRIAEMFSRRLQIQERLTKQVADAIMEIIGPRGVAVVIESSHMCMEMRGVEKTGTATITSCVLGCFKEEKKTRDEFMSLIGVNKTGV